MASRKDPRPWPSPPFRATTSSSSSPKRSTASLSAKTCSRPTWARTSTAIIRRRYELKNGGEQMNIPLVTQLAGTGIGTGTLAGNEEKIDNYGMRRLARLGPQRGRHQQGRAAEGLRRDLRRGQAAAVGLGQGAAARRADRLALMALPSESRAGQPRHRRPASASTASCTTRRRPPSATPGTPTTSDRVLFGNVAVELQRHAIATALANCRHRPTTS